MHRPSRVLSTRRIAGCRSLCNFVTSSIRPCNSVMTRNDAAARQAGRTCATGPVSPISTIFLPIPTSSPHLSFETFGKMKKFYSEIFFFGFLRIDSLYSCAKFSRESRVEGWNQRRYTVYRAIFSLLSHPKSRESELLRKLGGARSAGLKLGHE